MAVRVDQTAYMHRVTALFEVVFVAVFPEFCAALVSTHYLPWRVQVCVVCMILITCYEAAD
jgi:hypothetical protein